MPLRVVALISAYNEADIIEQTTCDLIDQGIQVYFLDDGSTDGTLDIVERYLGQGVLGVERLSETFQGANATGFEWERILRRKAQLANDLDADWFIHHDADEFRESPWSDVSLISAIKRVADLGFNAIDFACFEFWPVDDHHRAGQDVRAAFTWYAEPGPYDRVQMRCWKKTSDVVDLLSTGGHEVKFPGRKVFPLRFILRHYPIRGQAHGERKIYRERRPRFLPRERAMGWHVQYDELPDGGSFVRDSSTLKHYDPQHVRIALQLHHRGVEELEEAVARLRSEADTFREEAGTQAAVVKHLQVELARVQSELSENNKEIHRLRKDLSELETLRHEAAIRALDLQRLEKEVSHVRAELAERDAGLRGLRIDVDSREREAQTSWGVVADLQRQVSDLRNSKSWMLTRPLRAVDDLLHRRPNRTPGSAEQPVGASRPRVEWGTLARLTPVSHVWGIDRGVPVDRYYIDRFLAEHRADIHGRVLEVKDAYYASSIGQMGAAKVEVLDVDATNPRATLIADLANDDTIPADRFDCFILTQTLHIIYDIRSALQNAARLLTPGGVLLCTIPAVSRVNYEDGGLESGDYWRLTAAAVRRLFLEVFEADALSILTYGNVRVCAAFLYGLATEDLEERDLSYNDPWFPLVHCIRAVKQPHDHGS